MMKFPELKIAAQRPLARRIVTARQLFLIVAAVVTVAWLFVPTSTVGDAREYYHMWEALANHLSPGLRAADIANLRPILDANHVVQVDPYAGFFRTASGEFYSWHFWLYPLAAVPMKFLLRLTGQNELAAFQMTNVLLFFGAVYAALFHTQAPVRPRLLFVALAVVNPVLWYLRWPSPEVFSWAMTVTALVCLHNRKHAAAALAASLGAAQNPPMLVLAGVAVLFALYETRSLKAALLPGLGFLVSFLPNLFYLVKFGTPNLIVAHHAATAGNISLRRTWSFLLDLNQGMLPYVPFLLVLFGLAIYYSLKRLALPPLALTCAFFLMALLSEPTTNWNAGSDGMIRYAVWALPVAAWVIADVLPATRTVQWLLTAAAVTQLAVVIHGPGSHVQQSPLARLVLTHAPGLYNPDPEIFAERQLHAEQPFDQQLPIAFQDASGAVTKVLASAETLGRLPTWFKVDPAYYDRVVSEYRSRHGFFYLNPPKGSITASDVNERPDPEEIRSSLKIKPEAVPARTNARVVTVPMTLFNGGKATFFGPASGTKMPLGIAYHIAEGGKVLLWDGWRTWVPQRFAPGETVTLPVKIQLPDKPGRFMVEIAPVVETVDWGPGQSWLEVDVTKVSPDGYEATITPVSAEADRVHSVP